MKVTITICLLSLLVSPPIADAEIFKWTDENGVVCFSDKGIPSQYQKQKVTPSATSSSGTVTATPKGHFTQADIDKEAQWLMDQIGFFEDSCLRTLSTHKAFRDALCSFQKNQYQERLDLLNYNSAQFFAEKPDMFNKLIEEYTNFQKTTQLASDEYVEKHLQQLQKSLDRAKSDELAESYRQSIERFTADPDAYFSEEYRVHNR